MLPMETKASSSAQRLLGAFMQLRRFDWRQHQAPVSGLSRTELVTLLCIRQEVPPGGAGLRVSEISNMLRVTAPTATQQINDLETRGYVEKHVDPTDRRAVRILLTDIGIDELKKAHERILATFEGLAAYLGEEDSDKLAELLTRASIYFDQVREANS